MPDIIDFDAEDQAVGWKVVEEDDLLALYVADRTGTVGEFLCYLMDHKHGLRLAGALVQYAAGKVE